MVLVLNFLEERDKKREFSCFHDKQEPALCCLLCHVNAMLNFSIVRLSG